MLFHVCLAIFLLTRGAAVAGPNAVVLAVISAQLGLQLHDAGHHQMFRDQWKNTVIGFAALGMSYGWWLQKHNRHHANPNHVERDPDISNSAIAYT